MTLQVLCSLRYGVRHRWDGWDLDINIDIDVDVDVDVGADADVSADLDMDVYLDLGEDIDVDVDVVEDVQWQSKVVNSFFEGTFFGITFYPMGRFGSFFFWMTRHYPCYKATAVYEYKNDITKNYNQKSKNAKCHPLPCKICAFYVI